MNRRDILKCLAAGGAVVAGELWIPGQRLISIPKYGGYTITNIGGYKTIDIDFCDGSEPYYIEIDAQGMTVREAEVLLFRNLAT